MRLILIILFIQCFTLSLAYDFSKVDKALQELKGGNVQESVDQIKKAAAVNDMVAQFYLGQCYEHGIGMEKNLENAFKMYRRAAERGFAPAMKELSRCYINGVGVDRNSNKADEWSVRYNKRNDLSTITNLTDIYAQISSDSMKSDYSHNSPIPIEESGDIELVPQESQEVNTNVDSTKKSNYSGNPNSKRIQPVARPKSDVDIDIPTIKKTVQNLFALIIANENYQDVADVPHALNDGEIMSKYCKNTLGVPESNIHLIKNATLNNIKREISLMKKIATAYEGQASFIIYYAGHGFPDEKSRSAYLMPIDGYSSDMTTCYSLNDFYEAIGEMPSRKTVVMLDACFSGAGREGDMLVSARGVVLVPKQSMPTGNTLVISSASGEETAYPYNEKSHGLFTYFILQKLKESKGDVDLNTLVEYVKSNVTKKSLVINGKSQTPNILVSRAIGEEWKDWKIN